jgi:V-type H+-transporting ATPase subunit a
VGVDSIWKASQNEMQFTNSLKMKVAVIIGVIHMFFGLILRVINNFKQKNRTEFFMQTLPQIIFLLCTFVYMDFLIIYKWFTYYLDTQKAPSIISTMISIFVGMANPKPTDLLFWGS